MAEVSTRKYFIGGNWKCTGTMASTQALVEMFNQAGPVPTCQDVVIAPSALHLLTVASSLAPETGVQVAAQNIWKSQGVGAFTGELCADMVKDAGVNWVICGHSERRNIFGETDLLIAEKAELDLAAGLKVIFCIGEQLEERENGTTLEVCIRQLAPLKTKLSEADWANVVIAYEPVWAIGTGKVASPEQVEETHAALRGWLAAEVSPAVAAQTRIIYGGSVKGTNCDALIELENVDGFLVGGASITPDFLRIINHSKSTAE